MRRLLLPLVVAAVAVSATVFGSAFARSSEVVTYTDPAGDSGGDVDITRVAVDTDSASELVTFAVTVTGFAPSDLDGRRREIQVYLATDATWRTGFAELAFIVEGGPGGIVSYVGHPKPGTWPFEPVPPTMRFGQSGNVLTWTFDKAEFGDADGFNISMYTQVAAAAGGSTSVIADHAPDGVGRAWRYHYLESQPVPTTTPALPVVVRPVLGAPTTVPARPAAGKRLVLTLPVRRSDTGAPLTTGRLTCDPSISGIVPRHAESFRNGTVRLSLVVPRTARGKLLRVRVRITTGAASATKVVAYRVV